MPPYDTLLARGSLIDGTGRSAYQADLAIKGDRIVAIGELRGALAAEEIDIQGQVPRPWFHRHAHTRRSGMYGGQDHGAEDQPGRCHRGGRQLRREPGAGWTIRRRSPNPSICWANPKTSDSGTFRSYFDAVDEARPSTNVIALVGHSSLRVATMRDLQRPATPAELDTMLGLLDDAMRAGAGGLSTGVFYPPGRAADSGEIIPLVSKAGKHGGVYATHMRDEHDAVLDSMHEAFEAARVGGAPLLISHHKCAGGAQLGTKQGNPGASRRRPRHAGHQRGHLSLRRGIERARPRSPGRRHEGFSSPGRLRTLRHRESICTKSRWSGAARSGKPVGHSSPRAPATFSSAKRICGESFSTRRP